MPENYFNKIKYKFFFHIHHGRGLGLSIDISRDWRLLIASFLALAILVVVADIYIFQGDLGRPKSNMVSVEPDKTLGLDKAKLNKVVLDWRNKKVNFNKILEEKTKYVDPLL